MGLMELIFSREALKQLAILEKHGFGQLPICMAKTQYSFYFSDDQTYQGVHALGNEELRTPSLDKLVEEGVNLHTYF